MVVSEWPGDVRPGDAAPGGDAWPGTGDAPLLLMMMLPWRLMALPCSICSLDSMSSRLALQGCRRVRAT
jgi:hypothetical protein